MAHVITHITHDDGTHELWHFDDEGMTIETRPADVYVWGGSHVAEQAGPEITISGGGSYVATAPTPTLDDGIASLVTHLTRRANDAERAAKEAEIRARNARAAERASILALLKDEDDEADEGEGCHICGGPDH